ncbi:MAG: crossover junction endodeoxyribonuclease RuvC [Candidatus Cryptobacteroides sp.]
MASSFLKFSDLIQDSTRLIKNINILGIDPGTNLLGFGLIHVNDLGKPEFVDAGVLDLRKIRDPYEKLSEIRRYVSGVIDNYAPDCMAIESPFMGKNAQVIFKLGRAQGVALAVAFEKNLQIHEYAPRKAKISVCGNGAASKEQVSLMVQKILGIKLDSFPFDSTDALALALCHFYQLSSPFSSAGGSKSWENFLKEHPERVK